jgi:nitrite reductase/ring-hydroxylating ferredoxin subunit
VAFVRLAAAEQIPPGQTRFVQAGGTPVILANYRGRIHALYGICPHQGNPLEGAALWDRYIDCPFHHFQFDVATGENRFPKNVYPSDMTHLAPQTRPLETYAVEVRDGEIWVDVK